MKKLVLLLVILCGSLSIYAQGANDESRMIRNEDVIDMIKSGFGESIIIAKIKNSLTQFDVSTNGLKALKEAGAGDNLIVAIIEAKPKQQTLNSNQTPASLKEALGKKKVYVESNDDEVRLQAIKVLGERKFVLVQNADEAELVFEVKSKAESTVGVSRAPIFGGGTIRSSEQRACSMSVYLRGSDGRRLVYAKDIRTIYDDSFAAVFFQDGNLPGISVQVKSLIAIFEKELKKVEKQKK